MDDDRDVAARRLDLIQSIIATAGQLMYECVKAEPDQDEIAQLLSDISLDVGLLQETLS